MRRACLSLTLCPPSSWNAVSHIGFPSWLQTLLSSVVYFGEVFPNLAGLLAQTCSFRFHSCLMRFVWKVWSDLNCSCSTTCRRGGPDLIMNVSNPPAHMELAESTGLPFLFFPQFKTAPGTSKSGSSYSVVASLESISNGGLPYSMLMLIIKTGWIFTPYQPQIMKIIYLENK